MLMPLFVCVYLNKYCGKFDPVNITLLKHKACGVFNFQTLPVSLKIEDLHHACFVGHLRGKLGKWNP